MKKLMKNMKIWLSSSEISLLKDPTDLAAVSFRVQCYIDVKDFDNAEKLCSLLSDELKIRF